MRQTIEAVAVEIREQVADALDTKVFVSERSTALEYIAKLLLIQAVSTRESPSRAVVDFATNLVEHLAKETSDG